MLRRLAWGLLIVYSLFMMAITLLILGGQHPTLNLLPFRAMVHDWRVGGISLLVNFWGNLVAFMPFGVLLPLARVRPTRSWQILLFTGLFSLVIEVLQYAFANRNADIDDVILNATGGVIGYGLYRVWQRGRVAYFGTARIQSSSKTT